MSRRHFHIIVLGDCLAARIAGVLLARRGCRILAFRGSGPPVGAAWFQSSRLLEKILETLGGRSCYSAPVPLQVITDESRLELHGASPLEEELRREFPATHLSLQAAFGRLAKAGEQIENLLWDGASLPLFGPASRLKFAWRALRNGLDRSLSQPLLPLFAGLRDDPGGETAAALFTGLSLNDAERLTIAEGALLWSACSRPRGVSVAGLDALLRHRFEQFHGENADPESIFRLRLEGTGPPTVILQDGQEYSADHLLVGDSEFLSLLPEHLHKPPAAMPDLFTAKIAEASISPLVAPRVIFSADPPCRISLATRDTVVHCTTEISLAATSTVESETVRKRLSSLFPFAELDPMRQGEKVPAPAPPLRPRSAFPGAVTSIKLGRQLLLCHAPSVFPTLGAAGEALVGVSAANYLAGRMKLRP